ncbi:hypothetical protein CEXT_106251 [Caerostris extrusa]|uniref:Uncharacterized protein n=1 Tax=Caerostris extrusa TaxID=172846 RepID=A0AAV4Q8I8_CAEEX|nr:hypothetical protein CEXT_106251 [Caerostris extrusa]
MIYLRDGRNSDNRAIVTVKNNECIDMQWLTFLLCSDLLFHAIILLFLSLHVTGNDLSSRRTFFAIVSFYSNSLPRISQNRAKKREYAEKSSFGLSDTKRNRV